VRGPPTELRPRGARSKRPKGRQASAAKARLVVGWREWVSLPDFGIEAIKAKIDTGARTSVVHADDVVFVRRGRVRYVRFTIHPTQRSSRGAIRTIAKLVGHRRVRSSNGVSEKRPVVRTTLKVGEVSWPIELTLTSRDHMGFRMLVGRMALVRHALVDPSASYRTRKPPAKKRRKKKGPAK